MCNFWQHTISNGVCWQLHASLTFRCRFLQLARVGLTKSGLFKYEPRPPRCAWHQYISMMTCIHLSGTSRGWKFSQMWTMTDLSYGWHRKYSWRSVVPLLMVRWRLCAIAVSRLLDVDNCFSRMQGQNKLKVVFEYSTYYWTHRASLVARPLSENFSSHYLYKWVQKRDCETNRKYSSSSVLFSLQITEVQSIHQIAK